MNSTLPAGYRPLPGKKRPRRERGVTQHAELEAVLRNPATYRFGDDFDLPDPAEGGRPVVYPMWLWMVYASLVDAYGSARMADTQLHDPRTRLWEDIRTVSAEMLGEPADSLLPADPPTRGWYVQTRKRKIIPNLERARLASIEEGVRTAREVGLGDPDKP